MRFGILTGGGDVPGLNAAIKTVVHRVTDEGHSIVGLRRGWAGLLELDLDDPESVGRHILALDRKRLQRQRLSLQRKIQEAQKSQDSQLAIELLREQNELDKELAKLL